MLASIFNTTDRSGGAGIAAFRLSRALATQQVTAPIYCLHRRFADANTFRYRLRSSELSPSLQAWRDGLQRIQQRFVSQNRSSRSKTIFSSPWASGLLVGDNPAVAASRVLHLHWVNHFLDIHSLRELAALGRPIVWTLHDEWLFTAGCHYTTGCEQWRDRCTACPQLLHDPYGLVPQWFDEKQRLFNELDLTVVTPSAWLGQRARESTLLAGKRVEVIRNAFDDAVFAPLAALRRVQLRRERGFEEGTIVVGFGAQTLKDLRKGFGLLLHALDSLAGSAPDARIGLLVFGSRSEELDALAGRMTIAYAGELDDERAIADVLGTADVFVVPSLEENYPNVIIESLLCGTPVIAYGCGGVAEQIDDGVHGLVVQPVGDVEALAAALRRYVTEPALRERLRGFDRDAVARLHSFAAIGAQTVALYRELAPDFDAPVEAGIAAFLDAQRDRKGPERDLLAVASHRPLDEAGLGALLVGDEFDRVVAARRTSEQEARDRLYLGFFEASHRFGNGGQGMRFLNFGWSTAETQGVWSAERSAGIGCFVPEGTRRVELAFVGQCRGTSQVMIVRVGQQEVGRVKLAPSRGRHVVTFDVPEAAAGGALMQIRLDFPHAQPEPGTQRLLGLFLSELSARRVDSVE
jgi:glycosyltransferase involved in cell wall biosynthesis